MRLIDADALHTAFRNTPCTAIETNDEGKFDLQFYLRLDIIRKVIDGQPTIRDSGRGWIEKPTDAEVRDEIN